MYATFSRRCSLKDARPLRIGDDFNNEHLY
jgi:molybdenum cofactor synthesis domain-containing protein